MVNRNSFRTGKPVIIDVTMPFATAVEQGDMLKAALSSGVWGAIDICDARLDAPVLVALEEHVAAASAAADTRPKIACALVSNDAVYEYLVDNADYASDITVGDRFEVTARKQLGLVTEDKEGIAMAVEARAAVASGVVRYCKVVFMQPAQFGGLVT